MSMSLRRFAMVAALAAVIGLVVAVTAVRAGGQSASGQAAHGTAAVTREGTGHPVNRTITAKLAATNVGPCAASSATCDGVDPTLPSASGAPCSADATTVGSANVTFSNGDGGFLELRFSANCTTNWARFTPNNGGSYAIAAGSFADSVIAGTSVGSLYQFTDKSGVAQYSDMVFSPGPATACVVDESLTGAPAYCYDQRTNQLVQTTGSGVPTLGASI